MKVEECYKLLGGNYEEAKSRLMNDTLITKFLKKFLDDDTMNQLNQSVENKDIEGSFRAAHTLKGMTGNMAFTELYEASVALTEQLRPQKEEANLVLLENVKDCYSKTVQVIQQFIQEL